MNKAEYTKKKDEVFKRWRRGEKLKPGELKPFITDWYEGAEDDLNAGRPFRTKQERGRQDQIRSEISPQLKQLAEILKPQLDIINKRRRAEQPTLFERGKDLASNIVEGLGKAAGYVQESLPRSESIRKQLEGEDPRKVGESQFLDPDQLALQQQMGQLAQQYVPDFMQQLSKPIEMPQSQLGNNIGDILGLLSGPAMMTLMQRPSQNMFTGQFASQLPYQQNYSSGISTLLGTLGAPLLQQLLGRRG